MTGIILPLAAQIRPGMVMPDGDSPPQTEGGDSFTADAGEPVLMLHAGPVPVPEARADPLRDWLEDRAGISAGIGAGTGAEISAEENAEISAAMAGDDPAMTDAAPIDAAPPDVPQADRAPVPQPGDSGTQDTGRQDTGRQDTGLRETGLRETGLRETGLRETGLQTTAPRVAEAPQAVPDTPDPTTFAEPAGVEAYSRPDDPAGAAGIAATAPRALAAPTTASLPADAVAVLAASAPLTAAAPVSAPVPASTTARVGQTAEIDSAAVAPKAIDQMQDAATPAPVGPAILQAVGKDRPAASVAIEPVAGRAVTTDGVARNSTAADEAQPAAMPASPPAAATTRVAATVTAAIASTTSPAPADEQAAGVAMDQIMQDGRARPDPRAGRAHPAATVTDRAALPAASPVIAATTDSAAQDSAVPDRQMVARQVADAAPPARQPAPPVAASEPAAERLIRVTPPGPAMPEALRSDPVDPGSAAARVTGTVASPQQGEPARPEVVAPVLRQISGALVSTRAGMTEIMLAPEELGRLHMIWTGHDRPQLVLWAERPETLDLLRRNIDLLTAELQEAGVDAGLLDFRDGPPPELPGQARRDMAPEPEEAGQAQRIAVAASTSLAAEATRLASTRRIDVRL